MEKSVMLPSTKESHWSGKRGDSSTSLKGEGSDWNHVTIIQENDVLLGRGSRSNQPGNVKFRQLIKDNRFRYLAASKIDKPKIAEDVVSMWRTMKPPGRFLSRKDDKDVKGNSERKDEHAVWFDVGDKKARLKTSMALRERTPEAVNYLNIIRKQEVEETQRSAQFVKHHLELRGQQPQSLDELSHSSRRGQTPIHSQSFGEYRSNHPIAPIAPPNRRASFAGFPQRQGDRGLHQPQHHFRQQHPSSMHPRQMLSSNIPQPPRRSSLLGARQAELYIMQQQVKTQQLRLEVEMQKAEMEELMEAGAHYMRRPSMPPAPPAFSHRNYSAEVPLSATHNMPSHPGAPRAWSENTAFASRNSVTSSPSLPTVSPPEVPSRKMDPAQFTPQQDDLEFENVDLSPEMDDFDDSEDVVGLEKFRFMLQGWADRENATAGDDTSDMEEESTGPVKMPPRRRGVGRSISGCSVQSALSEEEMEPVRLPPRRRGVGRTVSGCSVQSALSDLMAMSIITSGTEDEAISVKSGDGELWFD